MATILIKEHYLSLGASNAAGIGGVPGTDGYVSILFEKLKKYGAKDYINLARPADETTRSFIKGGLQPGQSPRPSQLDEAVKYLKEHAGQVSPITLDLGSNDVRDDLVWSWKNGKCQINEERFPVDLAEADSNLKNIILPKLKEALTVNGQVTGSIIMMNFWNPWQESTPESGCQKVAPYIQELNEHMAADVSEFGLIADVFSRFDGHICDYTYMCVDPDHPGPHNPAGRPNPHANPAGYQAIAEAFAEVMGIG